MKKIKTNLFILALVLFANVAMAQYQEDDNTPVKPRWCSDKGHWVVESNVKTPENSIVYFYNANRKLVYTEKVNGVVLNCNKRKTLMKLKRVLEKVVDTYRADGVVKSEGELTALLTNKKKGA